MGVTRHPLFDDAGRLAGVPADLCASRSLRQSLLPLLAPDRRLVERFRERLFRARPELQGLLPLATEGALCRMRGGLALIVTHMVEPERLVSELAAFARANSRRGIRAEHYPIACTCLLEALREAAGDAWNADLEREWRYVLETATRALTHAGDQGPRRA